MRHGACLAGQLNWPAAKGQLQTAIDAGCRERFCFRWLVVTWLGLEQPAEAQAVLRTWQSLDHASCLVIPSAFSHCSR